MNNGEKKDQSEAFVWFRESHNLLSFHIIGPNFMMKLLLFFCKKWRDLEKNRKKI